MFELSADDQRKFDQYESILSQIRNTPTDDVFAIMQTPARVEQIKRDGLTTYEAAYSFAYTLVPSFNRANPEHQRILGLALEAQRNRWESLDASEQRLLLKLSSAKYDSSNQAAHLERTVCEVLGAGASLSGPLLSSAIKKVGANALSLFFGNLGNTADKGIGPDIIKKCTKLEAADFLQEGIHLTKEGLQYVQYREVLRKQTQAIFNQYHFNINTIDSALRNQLDDIVAQFQAKSQREVFEKGFGDAKEVFSKISHLGQLNKNETLSAIGAIGGAGVSIAYSVAHLAGAIPGLAAPTGFGMLLPGANIAFTALALFSMLANSADEDNNQALQEALQAISAQIKALHEEMRKHFEHMDQRLIKIHKDLLSGLEDLQRVVRSDIKSLKAALLVTYQKLESDINQLQKITEKGLIELRLDEYRKLLNSLESYVNGNSASLKDAKDELIKTIDAVEKNWLLGNLTSDMLNSGWHHSRDEKKRHETYRKVVNISDYVLNNNVALLTGYLAKVARETLDVKGIPAVLPNIELLAQGVKDSLAARTCLEQRHQYEDFDAKGEQLNKIRELAQNAVQFVGVIAKAPATLFQPLFAIYTEGVKALEEQVKQIVAEKHVAELAGKKCSLSSIPLPNIQPVAEQKDNPVLDVKHFLKHIDPSPQNPLQVPAILQEAQKWGVIGFVLDYKGSRSPAVTAKEGDLCVFGSNPYTYVHPAMPNYRLAMRVTNFPNQVHDSVLLTVDFKSNLSKQEVFRDNHGHPFGFSDNIESKYISKQNNIPLKDLCGNNWSVSNKQSEARLDEKFFEILQQTTPRLTAAITTKKINAAKLGNIEAKDQLKKLITEEDKACFVDEVNQLKAARAWIIAYCRLLGVSEYVVDQLAKDLIYDFEEFIQNPSLFDAQDKLATRCLSRIQDGIRGDEKLPASVSPVRLKASDIINQIDHFHQRRFSDKLVLEEKISKQLSIDKDVLLKPYRDMHRRWNTWCTRWLGGLGAEAERDATYTSCKTSYERLTTFFGRLDQALANRGGVSENVVEIFENIFKTGFDVHSDLETLSLYAKEDKYKLKFNYWEDSKSKEHVIKMLKELSRTSPVARVANSAADVKDVKDEKTRPLESTRIPSGVGVAFFDEKERASAPTGISSAAGSETLKRTVG